MELVNYWNCWGLRTSGVFVELHGWDRPINVPKFVPSKPDRPPSAYNISTRKFQTSPGGVVWCGAGQISHRAIRTPKSAYGGISQLRT